MRMHVQWGVPLALFVIGSVSEAGMYSYVDWTVANPAGGTTSGVITLADLSTVGVNFTTKFPSGRPGPYSFAQTSGGINYWNPVTPFVGAGVDNAPPTPDILAVIGGTGLIYTVTFSEAVKDPIMPIVSLGRAGIPTTYDFDAPFTIVSQGRGYWGGTSTSLAQPASDTLVGREGHGTIQFPGTYTSLSWVVPTRENWHGFTFGIRSKPLATPEPASLSLLALGALGIAGVGRLRKLAARRA